MFATSSKDCSAMIWDVTDSFAEAKLLKKKNFLNMGWEYTQYCEFSPNDQHLLVSGVNEDLFRGMVALAEFGGYGLREIAWCRIVIGKKLQFSMGTMG